MMLMMSRGVTTHRGRVETSYYNPLLDKKESIAALTGFN